MAIASINPATGQVLKTFEALTNSQIEDKLRRATEAFCVFRKTPFSDRARKMVRAAEILEAQKENYARLASLEMGKTFQSAVAEVVKCAWVCRFYAETAERFLADEVVATPAARSYVQYQPLGAILAVMPWNYPFWQAMRFAAPALMAGNVVLLKHASNVPQCALQLEELFRSAGFAPGVFQTLLVGRDAVDKLLEDSRVVAATLTGSEMAGIDIGMAAAKRVKKVVLELGGTDPFIVMPSADMDAAVATGVKARTANNGESCISAKRFILAEPIADEYESKFAQQMKSLKVGDPFEDGIEVGPLVNADAVATLDEQVRKTVAAGARVLAGGHRLDRPGYFYAPTVLTNIPAGSPGDCEELFGPVACVYRAKDAGDAIRIANNSRYGLGASVWTSDKTEAECFIRELESGMVFINQMVASDPRVPFGGVKRSGHGRELGVFGIREFTNTKTVWIQGGCG
jgi:succinate-semialdehyde dehydrogenase / glutarate-semialdehyde dehydrogenase